MARMSAEFLRCCAKFLLVLATSPAFAQSPMPLPVPNVPVGLQGTISAIARQPDGGLILGGSFTMIDGIPRRNLARLQPDGTLDPDWNPSADSEVVALAVNAAGDVYAGGSFKVVDGHPRTFAAKLSGTGRGSLDAYWNPGFGTEDVPDGTVLSLVVDTHGNVFAGGNFHSVGGLQRDFLAKLDGGGTGAVDPQWAPSIETAVNALAIGPTESLYVARIPLDNSPGFPTENLCDVLCIQKISTYGAGAAAADWNPRFITGAASALLIDAEGSLYASGSFGTAAGAFLTLVRFPEGSDGEIDDDWTSPITGSTPALLPDGAGGLYVGQEQGVSRLSTMSSGAVVVDWTSHTGKYPAALAIGMNGDLYSGGNFQPFGNPPTFGLDRLSPVDGSSKATVEAQSPGWVEAIAHQPNGGTIVGGLFSRAGAFARRNIFRIAPDGKVDPDWMPSLPERAMALAVDADNAVYAGTAARAGATGAVIKFAGSGSGQRDPLWNNPIPEGSVGTIALDPRGSTLVVGGLFSRVDGVSRRNIARLSMSDGSLDTTWNAFVDYWVQAVALDHSLTAYYVGGAALADPLNHHGLTKFSASSGAVDASWQPPIVSNEVSAIAVAPDDTIYIGGGRYASTWEGYSSRWSVEKISPAGLVLDRWDGPENADDEPSYVYALIVGPGGAVYAGGWSSSSGAHLTRYSGTADPSSGTQWSPAIDGGAINALELDGKGHLYVGGQFETIGAQSRIGLAALPIPSDPVQPRPHGQRPLPPIVRERPPRADNFLPPHGARER
jgi:hypothetical protein